MRTILIAAVIAVVAVLGWNWYESQNGVSATGKDYYGQAASSSSTNGSGAEDFDVYGGHTPLVSPNQTSGIHASGSVQIR